jgi:Rv0078B-related antitoxin
MAAAHRKPSTAIIRYRMSDVDASLEAVARRLRLALDLFTTGEDLMRQRLRREHPELAAAEIEGRLVDWLRTRPGAEFGDSPGTPVAWPRQRP